MPCVSAYAGRTKIRIPEHLLDPNARFLHQRRVFSDFTPDERVELSAATAHGNGAARDHAFPKLRIAQEFIDLAVQLYNYFLRHVNRRDHAIPGACLEAG